MWAEDWVLRACDEAVFRLPISAHLLFVSVSPTLGLVRHSWFSSESVIVYGCVGHNRFMLLWPVTGTSVMEHTIVEVGDDGMPPQPVGTVRSPCSELVCNRKWIVGFPSPGEMSVWRVVAGAVVQPELHFSGVEVGTLQFSPVNDDVLMLFTPSKVQPGRYNVNFCDLEASTNQGKLVSPLVLCSNRPTQKVLWRPDGSMCTLHYDYSRNASFVLDGATGKPAAQFPQYATVLPVGTSHVFLKAAHQFQVFDTGNMTSSPTVCVACTWASPSTGTSKSCLIASTSHRPLFDRDATEIKFAVHDGATGFHVGDFTVPFDASCFTFNSTTIC